MRLHLATLAIGTLLVFGPAFPGNADDAPVTPAAPTASQTSTPTQTEPPASVPRPSLVPKATEPTPREAADEPASRHRRYAHRTRHRYGYYRFAHWEPFPIYWPHFYRSRIHWSRIPWAFNF